MAKKTSPLQHMERWAGKQVKAFKENDGLSPALREQLTDWSAGMLRVLQTVDQVIDPNNPPGPDTAHGRLIALGRAQRELADLLTTGQGNAPAGDGQGPPPANGSQSPASQGTPPPAATAPPAQGAPGTPQTADLGI